MIAEQEHIARSSPLLKSIPPPIVDALLSASAVHEFDRGSTIFLQGEQAKAIFIVTEGWVKLYRISPNVLICTES